MSPAHTHIAPNQINLHLGNTSRLFERNISTRKGSFDESDLFEGFGEAKLSTTGVGQNSQPSTPKSTKSFFPKKNGNLLLHNRRVRNFEIHQPENPISEVSDTSLLSKRNFEFIKTVFASDLIFKIFERRKRAIELWAKVPKLIRLDKTAQSHVEFLRERMLFSGRAQPRTQKTHYVIRPRTPLKFIVYIIKLAGLIYNFLFVFYM